MTPSDLRTRVRTITERIRGLPVDAELEKQLNQTFPEGGEVFRAVQEACRAGIEGGWLCTQGGSGRRFGRIFEPAEDLAGYSVDVVELEDFVGPLHTHPEGVRHFTAESEDRPRQIDRNLVRPRGDDRTRLVSHAARQGEVLERSAGGE